MGHGGHSLVARGLYAFQLEPWLQVCNCTTVDLQLQTPHPYVTCLSQRACYLSCFSAAGLHLLEHYVDRLSNFSFFFLKCLFTDTLFAPKIYFGLYCYDVFSLVSRRCPCF
jgi:hypothetical protein